MIRYDELNRLSKILDPQSVMRLKRAAETSYSVEREYMAETKMQFKKIEQLIEYMLENDGDIDPNLVDFTELLQNHAFDTMAAGIKIANTDTEFLHNNKKQKSTKEFDGKKVELAKKKKKKAGRPISAPVPRSLAKLLEMREQYKKSKKPSTRVKGIAKKLNDAYIKKVQSVWKNVAKDFLAGNVQDKAAIIDQVKEAGRTVFSRAKTIVETETTYYYNKVRREVYDQSPEVTHYLFVSVRDNATTKWCKDRKGLVYKKDSKYLKDETPPIHWNCRSEVLPLTAFNPNHKKLIEDKSIQRENRKPEPLPPGWKAR